MDIRLFGAILALLLLTSTAFAICAKPTFANQDLNIVSDSCFYDGSRGFVNVDVNFANLTASTKSVYLQFTGLEGIDANITNVVINGSPISNVFDIGSFKSKAKINWSSLERKTIKFTLNFNLTKLAIGKEFNIELVDNAGVVIADLDPFLSGYGYRRQMTITNNNASYVLAGGIADSNNSIKLAITAEFGAKALANCNDVRVTWGETYELVRKAVGNCQSGASIYFNLPATISAGGTDNNYYVYYGNAGASAPTTDTNLILLAPSTQSTILNNFDGNTTSEVPPFSTTTITNGHFTSELAVNSQSVFLDGTADSIDYTADLINGADSGTIEIWANLGAGNNAQHMGFVDCYNAGTGIQAYFAAGAFPRSLCFGWDGVDACTGNVFDTNKWYHIIMIWDDVANTRQIIANNVLVANSAVAFTTTASANLVLGNFASGGATTGLQGYLDGFRYTPLIKKAGFFMQKDMNSTALQPTAALGAEQMPVYFADLNLFQFGFYNQNVDLTINSDFNIQFDFNIKSASLFDKNSLKTYYMIESSRDDQNINGYVRNQPKKGWTIESSANLSYSILSSVGDINALRSAAEDDHAFKRYSYNIDPDDFDTSTVADTQLTGLNAWVKIVLTNIQRDKNVFYNLSWRAQKVGALNKILNIYDCNQSVATPIANSNCLSDSIDNAHIPDLDGYHSFKTISNDLNAVGANNVVFNADGNHFIYFNCPNCTVGQSWQLYSNNQNSNIDQNRNFTSTTGVAALAPYAKTFDVHYHYADGRAINTFRWLASITKTLIAADVNSSVYSEVVNFTNVPPRIIALTKPTAPNYYRANMDVNMTVRDPNSDLLVCDFNLLNPDASYKATIDSNVLVVGNYCTASFNTTTVIDGNYLVKGVVRELYTTEKYSESLTMDLNFNIDNTKPTTTFTGCGAGWHTTDQNFSLSCADANSGCLTTAYRLDLGAWTAYSTNVNLTTDGNHQIDYNSTDRAGNIEITKTTYCAIDKTAPSVGITTLSGFSTSGAFINGTGTIVGGAATDATSGINTATCRYTTNGSTWLAATWNANHCEKTSYAIADGLVYQFNTDVNDNATNHAQGTATGGYTGDTNAPTTTKTGCASADMSSPQDVNLTCLDTGSGCGATTYRIDLGAWTVYSGTLTFNTDGNHQIDYNSIDLVLNAESIKTSYCDINAPAPAVHPAPDVNIVYPNGGEVFDKTAIAQITVIFTVQSSDSNVLYIDLNTSTTGSQGTGSEVLLAESTGGVNILCDDADFGNDTNCSYNLSIGALSDGNYFLLMQANTDFNSAFDATDGNFQIFTPTPVTPTAATAPPRYINPASNQRDTNDRYFNPTSAFLLSEPEKQTAVLTESKNLIFIFGLIIIVSFMAIGVVLWRKK